MSFDVSAEAYARFMGRFSTPLAAEFLRAADVRPGQRALDVGCGPGQLTEVLVDRLGLDAVAAIDPSPSFVQAVRERFPGIDVRAGVAEQLPFADAGFDAALAQLVVHFMSDPLAGIAEMARVTRPEGVVAACVWDHGPAGRGPLSLFWQAAQEMDPQVTGEAHRPGVREGHLAELLTAAGLREVEATTLEVHSAFASFDEWWEPYELGVGPAGSYAAALDEDRREQLRARCAAMLPAAPFVITATAWCAVART